MKLEDAERSLTVSLVTHTLGVLRTPVLLMLGAWQALRDAGMRLTSWVAEDDG